MAVENGILFRRSEKGIDCRVCQRECSILPGETGFCGAYLNKEGEAVDLSYGRVNVAQITRLGWAPVKMFANPETRVLSIGSLGCNFQCNDCVNAEYSYGSHAREVIQDELVQPELLVDYAQAMGAEGVVANFNEALLSIEYWSDIFRIAKERGLFTVAVTNGYSSKQALDLIAPHLNVYRCDVKAMRQETMDCIADGISPQGVLDSIRYVKETYPGVHIEVVTTITPGVNDSPEELITIAAWIRDRLGDETPWHLSPFERIDSFSVVKKRPPYVKGEELGRAGNITCSSLRFERDEVALRLGDTTLDELPKENHSHLEVIANLAREQGLKNVFVKTDGH